VTLVLTMGITAAYHLGYPQFPGSDLVQPEIGAVIATIPTMLSGNPVGAVVSHATDHIGANVHTYSSVRSTCHPTSTATPSVEAAPPEWHWPR